MPGTLKGDASKDNLTGSHMPTSSSQYPNLVARKIGNQHQLTACAAAAGIDAGMSAGAIISRTPLRTCPTRVSCMRPFEGSSEPVFEPIGMPRVREPSLIEGYDF